MAATFDARLRSVVHDFEARLAEEFDRLFSEHTVPTAEIRGTLLRQHEAVEHAVLSSLQAYRAHLNTFALISTLPVEVLLAVFQFCQVNDGHASPTWTNTLQPVIDLTHVCRRWRQIALNHPSLWTVVCAKGHSELTALPDVLLRSQTLPLDISFEWRRHASHRLRASTTVALKNHMHHVRSLKVHIREERVAEWSRVFEADAPCLEEFELIRSASLPEPNVGGVTLYNFFLGTAPALRRAHCENVPLDVLDSQVFRAVVDLHVSMHTISPKDVRAILASCPNVDSLSIAGSPSGISHARAPQAQRDKLWPAQHLARLSLTDIDPRVTDIVVARLPVAQLAFIDVACSDEELFSAFELSASTIEMVLARPSMPKNVVLQGKVHSYPPRVSWDVVVFDDDNWTRAFTIARLPRYPALTPVIQRTPNLTVSLDMWSMLVDALPDPLALDAQKLSLQVTSSKAVDIGLLDGCRRASFPSLRRVIFKAKTSKPLPRLAVLEMLNKIIDLRGLRHGRLKRIVLKGIRPSDTLDDLQAIAQQIDVQP